jgi:peptide-methionine (S)-S-oxide reductase
VKFKPEKMGGLMGWILGFGMAALLNAAEPVTVGGGQSKAKGTNMTELATVGGGCFWCIEAFLERVPGVKSVVSGYAGGHKENPTYREVCAKTTGHAEVVQVEFDPSVITFEQLLEVFWVAHDPTTPDRQGADVGPQYRSIILYHDAGQLAVAERSKAIANARLHSGKIVTEIVPLAKFYRAEEVHQDYFRNNPNQPYCQAVIVPKLLKLQRSGVVPK